MKAASGCCMFLPLVQDVRTFTRESLSFTVPKRARKHDHEYQTSKDSMCNMI